MLHFKRRKKLRSFSASMEGLEAFRAEVVHISANGVVYAEYTGDVDLKNAADSFRGKFDDIYAKKVEEIQNILYF